jgi:hypothetical protein
VPNTYTGDSGSLPGEASKTGGTKCKRDVNGECDQKKPKPASQPKKADPPKPVSQPKKADPPKPASQPKQANPPKPKGKGNWLTFENLDES